ncbi:hypothetical protein MKQ70_20260 [Chitinophaga sedimenti]|uniref:hypothetical protein n=1 Tax=Chitinophaga sedimenti TaxID=2033606 RepID=UPI002004A474|nr:hypothetical protein [Chitinophaga sedimenti]MCK7557212.1 hypothetical protein [Chitinophaga sedimenti]
MEIDEALRGWRPVRQPALEPLLPLYDNIVGVHVNPLAAYNPGGGFLANVDRTLHMAIHEGVAKNRQRCSIFIEPATLARYSMFDFRKFDEIYQAGFNAACEVLDNARQ